jgi:hypothetical protein
MVLDPTTPLMISIPRTRPKPLLCPLTVRCRPVPPRKRCSGGRCSERAIRDGKCQFCLRRALWTT